MFSGVATRPSLGLAQARQALILTDGGAAWLLAETKSVFMRSADWLKFAAEALSSVLLRRGTGADLSVGLVLRLAG
jgi:hypothetical protein